MRPAIPVLRPAHRSSSSEKHDPSGNPRNAKAGAPLDISCTHQKWTSGVAKSIANDPRQQLDFSNRFLILVLSRDPLPIKCEY
jgi:hypothetical protein